MIAGAFVTTCRRCFAKARSANKKDWTPSCVSIGRSNDRICIDLKMPMQVRDGSCLAKVLNAKRHHLMTCHGAKPGQGQGVTIADGNDPAMAGKSFEQRIDMGHCRLLTPAS